jgi:hypothetical protein
MSDHVSIEEASINSAGDVDVVAIFRDATYVPATSGKKSKRKVQTGTSPVYCAGTIPITAFPAWLDISGESSIELIQLIEHFQLLSSADNWKFLTIAEEGDPIELGSWDKSGKLTMNISKLW